MKQTGDDMNSWNSPTQVRSGLSRRGESYSWSGPAAMLHICAYCRRVRDDDGVYATLEGYVSDSVRALFSHGICADCAAAR